MRKLLFLPSMILILISFWIVYYSFTPKVGPIGNGVNLVDVWIQFFTLFILGVFFLFTAFIINYSDKRKKLRIIYILINAFWYVMFIAVSLFLVMNWDGLKEINRLSIWVMAVILLLSAAIFQSYRINNLIKKGKI
jgi:lysylphosphatidylglycerol synthetase-like protein (DUF2156 family)